MGNTFRKEERLCSHNAIEKLFERGDTFYFHPLKIYYLDFCLHQNPTDDNTGDRETASRITKITTHQKSAVKVLFSAPKKNFKHAVDRNRLKRQMKEAYRQNKSLLEQKYYQQENNLLIAFVYTSKKLIPYSHIEESIQKSILKICETINGANNGV